MKLSRPDLGDLYVFLNLARHGGFRRAAAEMDVSASALSHSLRGLEERLGVRLITRSKINVILTAAGDELLERCKQGFGELERGVEALERYRPDSEGRLRLSVPKEAALQVLGPVLARYATDHPDVRLDVVVQDALPNAPIEGVDAEVRFGADELEGLIALPIGHSLRWIMVASPAYLTRRGEPWGPDDLRQHRCIGVRAGSGEILSWKVGSGAELHTVTLEWSVVVSDAALAIEVAKQGGGITYCLSGRVAEYLKRGELQEVLPSWASEDEAFHLYFPTERQESTALRALISLFQENSAN